MRRPRFLTVAASFALILTLSACGSSSEREESSSDGADAAASDAFPVTIKNTFGETTIKSKPQRIATVAWANHEVPLALGVVPVGMSKATWGDDDSDGVLPWVEDKLEELDADTPVLFDETEGIDFEAVADTRPDVILASYSGLTKEDYETLGKIAPVVSFPDIAWATSVQDMVRLNSTAIGMKDEGEDLIAELDKQVDESFAKYPALKGKSLIFSYFDPADMSQIGFYTTNDTRPGFMESVGMTMPAAVTKASAGSQEFLTTVSAEKADEFSDVDLFVTYGDADGKTLKGIESDPLLSKIPAINKGAVAVLEESTPLAASANPSPLSIPWGIDEYFALLASAAAKG